MTQERLEELKDIQRVGLRFSDAECDELLSEVNRLRKDCVPCKCGHPERDGRHSAIICMTHAALEAPRFTDSELVVAVRKSIGHAPQFSRQLEWAARFIEISAKGLKRLAEEQELDGFHGYIATRSAELANKILTTHLRLK